MKSFFKKIARVLVKDFFINKVYKNCKEVFLLVLNKKNRLYHFSFLDIWLYISEINWKVFTINQIEQYSEEYLLKINNISLYWPKHLESNSLPWLYNEVFYPFNKNPSSYNNPLLNIQNCDWVLDGGACEGFFSIFCNLKGVKKVIAVEPNKIIAKSLAKTLKDIYKMNDAIILEAGLGDRIGNGFLEYNTQHPSDSFINKNHKEHNIVIETIDNIVEKNGLNNSGLIKLDIEGFEMDALIGAELVLRNKKPKLAIAIYHSFENAILCRDIILKANPSYKIIFRGVYGYNYPLRPYMLFAH
jgi:FkbM family methyltransferase